MSDRPLCSVPRVDLADSRHDLTSLINACLACSGGLRTFARIVYQHQPGEASRRVVDLSDTVMGPSLLSASDRDALRRHLSGIAVGQIADAVGELVEADELRTLEVWRDIPRAIRMLESLPSPADGVPQLLTFTDRLAHVVTGAKSADLKRWIDTVAGGLGVDQDKLAHLRAISERGVAGRRSDESGLIRGGVPIRNRNFSGRVAQPPVRAARRHTATGSAQLGAAPSVVDVSLIVTGLARGADLGSNTR